MFETDVSPSEILETLLDEEAARMRKGNRPAKSTSATETSVCIDSPPKSTSNSPDPSMASPNFRFGNLGTKQQELIKDFYLRVNNLAYNSCLGASQCYGSDLRHRQSVCAA